jgi:hypothetical protein
VPPSGIAAPDAVTTTTGPPGVGVSTPLYAALRSPSLPMLPLSGGSCGPVGLWACGPVGLWACGPVGLWACGRRRAAGCSGESETTMPTPTVSPERLTRGLHRVTRVLLVSAHVAQSMNVLSGSTGARPRVPRARIPGPRRRLSRPHRRCSPRFHDGSGRGDLCGLRRALPVRRSPPASHGGETAPLSELHRQPAQRQPLQPLHHSQGIEMRGVRQAPVLCWRGNWCLVSVFGRHHGMPLGRGS